jgi:tRNA dimethylallyltransferase
LKSLLIIAGPTASGKTAVGLEIAKKLSVETISFDSMQVYRGLPIVTQAPSAAEKKALKAHLVSFLPPYEMFDAARFREASLKLIPAIEKKGRVPLLSGGTGLYLRMLLDGLFESEGASNDPKLRAKLLKSQERHGGDWLHAELKKVDPASAARIHPNDHRRLVRALEVRALTGKPLSERKLERKGIRGDYYCPVFFLERDRADLYARIERRVDAMVKQGLVSEVKRALKKKLGLTASGALGIKEVKGFLEKQTTLEEAVLALKQHTRNYAKRQLSWFRHEKGVVRAPVGKDEKPAVTAKKILKLWEASKK